MSGVEATYIPAGPAPAEPMRDVRLDTAMRQLCERTLNGIEDIRLRFHAHPDGEIFQTVIRTWFGSDFLDAVNAWYDEGEEDDILTEREDEDDDEDDEEVAPESTS